VARGDLGIQSIGMRKELIFVDSAKIQNLQKEKR